MSNPEKVHIPEVIIHKGQVMTKEPLFFHAGYNGYVMFPAGYFDDAYPLWKERFK